MEKSITITSIVVAGIVLVAFIGFLGMTELQSSEENTVDVLGEATIKTDPDLVSVYFNVKTEGETSEEATKSNSETVEELKNSLVSEGFSKEDIKTQNFNVYPNYDWSGRDRIEDGFVATHSIKVELPVEDTEKIGSVVDAGVGAGAEISHINFELKQETQSEYKAEAMKLAAQDARVKAESVAEGFDKRLGGLVKSEVNEFNYYPRVAYESSGDLASAEEARDSMTDIQPSEQEINARVTATFKLI